MIPMSMAMANPPKSSGTLKFLWEALHIPTNNLKLILPILLLSVLTSSPLFCSYISIFPPHFIDLALIPISIRTANAVNLEYLNLIAIIQNEIKQPPIMEVILLIIAFIFTTLLTTASIHAIAMMYTGNLLTPKDLLSKIKRALVGPVITQLFVMILHLGYAILFAVPLVNFSILSKPSIVFFSSCAFVSLWALLHYIYLATIWLFKCGGLGLRGRLLWNGGDQEGHEARQWEDEARGFDHSLSSSYHKCCCNGWYLCNGLC